MPPWPSARIPARSRRSPRSRTVSALARCQVPAADVRCSREQPRPPSRRARARAAHLRGPAARAPARTRGAARRRPRDDGAALAAEPRPAHRRRVVLRRPLRSRDCRPDWRMDVPPHPHTGLQTVSWLLAGEVRHRDSLGSDVVIEPGQLNLMTERPRHRALGGVGRRPGRCSACSCGWRCPSRPGTGRRTSSTTPTCRSYDQDGAEVRVVVGSYGEATSPATTYSPLVGLDVVAAAHHGPAAAPGVRARGAAARPVPPRSRASRCRSARCCTWGRTATRSPSRGDAGTRLLADRRRAVRGGARHVVELRRPLPRRGRAGPGRLAGAGRPGSARCRRTMGDRLPAPELPGVPLKPRARIRPPRRT